MSNYKPASRKQAEACFSFSHSKKNSRVLTTKGLHLTPSEQRGLVGWISAILQPYTEEFLHAFASSKGRSIVDLSAYTAYNYPHLKEIVRYFIIGFLVDSGWSNWNQPDTKGKQSNDVFLNILVEELAGRFYRESQWLTKIMHLPIHQIFLTLDSFAKGYITLHELVAFSAQQIDFQAPSARLIRSKLKSNLGGLVERIYQENLREVQLRVDLTAFACGQLEKGEECSQSYAKIYAILSRWGKKAEDERMQLEQLEYENSRKKMEQLELSRENFRIRSISKDIVDRTPSKTQQNGRQDYNTSSASKQDRSLPSDSIKPLSQSKGKERPKLALRDLHPQPNGHLPDEIEHSRRLAEMAIEMQISQAQQQQAVHHDRLLVKAAILSELEHIKFAKFHNRHHLCSYI